MTERNLAVFAKYWQSGSVKTRLAKELGLDGATHLYYCFVTTLLHRLKSVGDRRWLCYSPADRQAEFAQIAGHAWALIPQGDGDLGERLERFFRARLADAGRRVILLGSDSPNLPLEYLDRAFELLEQYPVVLGPSDDGGYYLLGLSGSVPPLFHEIAWGSGEVWRQTVERLRQLELPFGTLPRWYDVDRLADLQRLASDLTGTKEQSLEELWGEILGAIDAAMGK